MERPRRARGNGGAAGRVRARQGGVSRASRALCHGEVGLSGKRKVIVVCGPTACGKSTIADWISAGIKESEGVRSPTVVVDSMQVYREIPVITNQARERPAELVGIVSVTEEWTVARHREATRGILRVARSSVVLDAGTGMYLNAVLLNIPLAPKVSPRVRQRAQSLTRSEENPRRASRSVELALAGGDERGSIWDGDLLFDVTMIYVRPERNVLDERIRRRSARIAEGGIEEAESLVELARSGTPPNPSVMDSIGVRELTGYVRGEIPHHQAQSEIETRTRKLARRQMRWFDKLARTLRGRAEILTVNGPDTIIMSQMVQNVVEV